MAQLQRHFVARDPKLASVQKIIVALRHDLSEIHEKLDARDYALSRTLQQLVRQLERCANLKLN